jgi:hypothetical protein
MRLHCTDQELLLALDGELGPESREWIQRHLAACAVCQEKQASFARASADVLEIHRGVAVPAGAKAGRRRKWEIAALAAACAVVAVLTMARQSPPRTEYAPDPNLTPGAVVRGVSREAVCGAEAEPPSIGPATAREVFRRYGVRDPQPRDYEVDYLIPPDLGGSGEADNLWPQPYSRGVWNSRVKDALEDRLRARVCSGQMELRAAQKELAAGWIEAYRRHFHTDQPLYEHAGFVKDPAWE